MVSVVFQDRMHIWLRQFGSKPFLHGGLDSPPLAEHLRVLDFALPHLTRPGRAAFKARALAGEVDAALILHTDAGRNAPVLIYHHDTGEIPVWRTAEQMFPRRQGKKSELTIYVVEAPFHESARAAKDGCSSLLSYLTMMSVSIAATERLMETRAVSNAPKRVVAGYGQGGYVTNWHHILHDTADAYIPFMAGAAPAEPFLSSLPTAAGARRNADHLRERLNFEGEWGARNHEKVFPVLASADAIIPFESQARSYGETPIEVWGTGHIAAAKQPERLRAKILKHIQAARGH